MFHTFGFHSEPHEPAHKKSYVPKHTHDEQRFRLLVEAVPHGIVECDIEGVITYTNPAYAKMHGYNNGERLATRFEDWSFDESVKEDVCKHLAQIVSKQPSPPIIFRQKPNQVG